MVIRKRTVKKPRDIDGLRDELKGFKDLRSKNKALELQIKNQQPELLPLLAKSDPGGNGIICDDGDTAASTAFYQQNAPGEFWDVEGIITYLKKSKSLWVSCSSEVFDTAKWEAEISNGNIPAFIATKYKKIGLPPKPFIRFGKAKDESV